MKVIFLDIDGVLISHRSVLATKDTTVDPISVQLLNRVLTDFDAKIVLTSTHRKEFLHTPDPLGDMQKYLISLGVLGERCVDYTRPANNRGQEIATWLNNNKVELFIVLDDSEHAVQRADGSTIPELNACFVYTDQRLGISAQDYRDMTALFGDPDTGGIYL